MFSNGGEILGLTPRVLCHPGQQSAGTGRCALFLSRAAAKAGTGFQTFPPTVLHRGNRKRLSQTVSRAASHRL